MRSIWLAVLLPLLALVACSPCNISTPTDCGKFNNDYVVYRFYKECDATNSDLTVLAIRRNNDRPKPEKDQVLVVAKGKLDISVEASKNNILVVKLPTEARDRVEWAFGYYYGVKVVLE